MSANGLRLGAYTTVAGAPFSRAGSVAIYFRKGTIIIANTCGRYADGSGVSSFQRPYVNVLATDGVTSRTFFVKPLPAARDGKAFGFTPRVFTKAVGENMLELLEEIGRLRVNGTITREERAIAEEALRSIHRGDFPKRAKKVHDNNLALFEINFQVREGRDPSLRSV